MKKFMFLAALLAVSLNVSAMETELKLGLDLYRDLTKDAFGNNPVNTYPGGSIGAEVLLNEDSPFRFGLGAEAKSSFNGKDNQDHHYAFPLYAVGKYDIGETVYTVARAGYSFTEAGDADSVQDANGGFYGGIGLGKEFMDERFNIELLYEFMEYDYDTDFNTNESGNYHGVALKFGMKFGGPSPAPIVAAPVVIPEPVVVEPEPIEIIVPEPIIEEPVVIIPPSGIKLRETFKFDSFDLNETGMKDITEVSDSLKGFSGTIKVEGHTDSKGREAYNQTLSEKRAKSVADEIMNQLDGEDITVEYEGFGEKNPIAPNDTEEGRMENRRVEVFWFPTAE